MRTVEFGEKNRDVVLLLHGGGLSWWNYRDAAAILGDRFHVVLPVLDVSEMMGSSIHLHVTADDKDVIVIVPTQGAATNFPMGSQINMTFDGNVAHVFNKETGTNLEW